MSIKIRRGANLVTVADVPRAGMPEAVQVVSDAAATIDASAGTMVSWTPTGAKTLQGISSLPNGLSLTLMIADGSVDWLTVINRWVTGEAPDITDPGTHVVVVWRIGDLNYGAYVGNAT
jgi:hypothetical protein